MTRRITTMLAVAAVTLHCLLGCCAHCIQACGCLQVAAQNCECHRCDDGEMTHHDHLELCCQPASNIPAFHENACIAHEAPLQDQQCQGCGLSKFPFIQSESSLTGLIHDAQFDAPLPLFVDTSAVCLADSLYRPHPKLPQPSPKPSPHVPLHLSFSVLLL